MENLEAGKRAKSARPEGKKAAPLARAASSARETDTSGAGWYILTQGSTCTMFEAGERPSSEPNEGDPLINLIGPFQTREATEKVHSRMSSRLLGAGPRERGRGEK